MIGRKTKTAFDHPTAYDQVLAGASEEFSCFLSPFGYALHYRNSDGFGCVGGCTMLAEFIQCARKIPLAQLDRWSGLCFFFGGACLPELN